MTEAAAPPAAPPVAPPAAPPAAPTDWRSGLTGDFAPLAQDKTLSEIKGKDWGEAGPIMAKMLVASQKLVGQKTDGMVRVPADGAKPEEIAAFRKALGVPDSPEGYQVTRPEVAAGGGWSDEWQAQFQKEMHAAGATPQSVQAAVSFYGKFVAAEQAAAQREAQAVEQDLRAKWGPNYDANLGRANRAIQEFGGDQLIQLFAQNGMGRHPLVVAAFSKIGNSLVEHGAMTPEGPSGMSPSDARARIAEIRRDKTHPLNNQSSADFQTALNEIVALQRIADRKE